MRGTRSQNLGIRPHGVMEIRLRVGKVVAYPPLCKVSASQPREFHEALLEADS
jgi:hypothetical protein